MARPTIADLRAELDEKVARILSLEAQLAELRSKASAPSAQAEAFRVTERGALYHVRHYGRFWKVAVHRNADVRAALNEFRASHPLHANSTIAVERFDA